MSDWDNLSNSTISTNSSYSGSQNTVYSEYSAYEGAPSHRAMEDDKVPLKNKGTKDKTHNKRNAARITQQKVKEVGLGVGIKVFMAVAVLGILSSCSFLAYKVLAPKKEAQQTPAKINSVQGQIDGDVSDAMDLSKVKASTNTDEFKEFFEDFEIDRGTETSTEETYGELIEEPAFTACNVVTHNDGVQVVEYKPPPPPINAMNDEQVQAFVTALNETIPQDAETTAEPKAAPEEIDGKNGEAKDTIEKEPQTAVVEEEIIATIVNPYDNLDTNYDALVQ